MKSKLIHLAIVSLFMLFSNGLFAQPGGGPPPPPPSHGQEDNQDGPLGTGLGILALLGIAYGAKKLYDAKQDFKK